MKLAKAVEHVKGSQGIQEKQTFKINTSAHAFKMLSSGLYADKIGAVLREVGCNATDAHIEAGTPTKPIEVKLPNRIDTGFYIKDWGPGLSHEDVMDLYTTYFASTKQTSNDFTGAFGLGSKSPFSYVDSFTVTSVHGGKKRTYSAHLDNSGSPVIALLTTEDAEKDWPHGMLIGFSVKRDDYESFKSKACAIYRWFRVVPNVLGAPDVEPYKRIVSGPKFFRAEDVSGPHVLMGNVLYPLDQSQFSVTELEKQAFHVSGLVIEVDVGDVQVAASREALQYDPGTLSYLMGRLTETVTFIGNDMADSLRKLKGAPWADMCNVQTVESAWTQGSAVGYSYNHNYSALNWSSLFGAMGIADKDELVTLLFRHGRPAPRCTGTRSLARLFNADSRGRLKHLVIRDGNFTKKDLGAADIELELMTTIATGKASYPIHRVRQMMASGAAKQVLLISPKTADPSDVRAAAAEAESVSKALGDIPMVDIAAQPLPPNFVPAKGKSSSPRKVKGASLPPLPSEGVTLIDCKFSHVKGIVSDPRLPKAFMVSVSRGYRVFNKSEDADKVYDHYHWKRLWELYQQLQQELTVPDAKTHVLVTATRARSYALLERGWKTADVTIKDYLSNPAAVSEVAARAAAWRPTVDLDNVTNWAGRLVWIAHKHPDLYKTIKPVLAKIKLDVDVEEILAASVAAGPDAGRDEPPAVKQYNLLCDEYSTPPVSIGTRSYTSADDLERQLKDKYPALGAVPEEIVPTMVVMAPSRLPQLMLTVLT